MIGKIQSVLLKRPEQAFISQENLERRWEEFNYAGCPDYQKVIEEYNVFEKIIKDHVPNVYYLPEDGRTGLDSIYTHDALKITKKGAVYFNMGKLPRSGEPFASEDYLKSIGVPTLGRIVAPGTLEGGDVLWVDEKTVAIGRGYRTNDEGIRQFKEITKDVVDEYIVVPMPHGDGPDYCLHLMSVISPIDHKKAVVYSRYMPVFFRQYLVAKGWTLIECNDEEYDYLGTNLLCLEPGKCVLIEGCPEIEKKVRDSGVTVYTYPGHELSFKGLGGATCMTCPIERI